MYAFAYALTNTHIRAHTHTHVHTLTLTLTTHTHVLPARREHKLDTPEIMKALSTIGVQETTDLASLTVDDLVEVYTHARIEFHARALHSLHSLRDVERRPVLCSFKRIDGGSAYQKNLLRKIRL